MKAFIGFGALLAAYGIALFEIKPPVVLGILSGVLVLFGAFLLFRKS